VNPRTTGILLVVAAALGAFVYLYEIRGAEERKDAEELGKRLFPDVEAEDVTWISLTTSDGVAARVERRDEGWEIVAPITFAGDEFAVDAMASALSQLSSEAVYEDPQPPEVYGLGEGARSIAFGVGAEEHRLRIGDKTPMGGNSYAAVDDSDDVHTVRTYRVSGLEKGLDDLRDKRVLRFDTDSVQGIAARWPEGQVQVEREGDSWRVTDPVQARADEATVNRVLSSLSFLRATGFEDEPRGDAETGLEAPDLRMELSLAPAQEGGEPVTLAFAMGREIDGERMVRAEAETLYRVPAARIEDVPREVVEWRFKELSRFSTSDAERVELLFRPDDADPVTVTLSLGEEGWSSAPEPMGEVRIEELVDELSRLRAEDILAESVGESEREGLGLDPPRVTISVYGEKDGAEARLARVLLGSYRGSQGIVAQAEGDPVVYQLAAAVAEFVPVTLDAFLNRFVAREDEPGDEPEAGTDVPGTGLDAPELELEPDPGSAADDSP
jgi:hypothetical protein